MKLLKLPAYWGLLLVLILSFWVVRPLFMQGFFPMHDDTQVSRIFEMGKSLKDGMFPVRWVNDLGYGYGYPIFNFYAPLAYYFGGFLIILGVDALLATKLTFVIGIILAGVSMYFFARSIFGEYGGILSALFYLYAIYHAVDIYVRGDIAEFWAYAFIPLLFWGLKIIFFSIKEDNKKNLLTGIVIGAIGFSGLILSHSLSAFMATFFLIPFSLMLAIFSKKKFLTSILIISTVVLGLMISSFYWLPVPFEVKYTNVFSQIGGSADFHQHFVCITQFWYSPWGYGGSVPGCVDGLSFMLGKIYILLSFLSLIEVYFLWKKNRIIAIALLSAFIGWMISLFLTTEYSQFVWNSFSVMSFLQYPWRFLSFASFFSSFLAGGFIVTFKFMFKKMLLSFFLWLIVIVVLLIFQAKYFKPQKAIDVQEGKYISQTALNWDISKISDEYMPRDFSKPKARDQVASSAFLFNPSLGENIIKTEKTQEKYAKLHLSNSKVIPLGVAYFPAWRVYVDTVSARVNVLNGKFFITVPGGDHSILLKFEQTAIEKTGNIISLAGFIILLLGIIYIIL